VQIAVGPALQLPHSVAMLEEVQPVIYIQVDFWKEKEEWFNKRMYVVWLIFIW
jgi:hypothetical protein